MPRLVEKIMSFEFLRLSPISACSKEYIGNVSVQNYDRLLKIAS
jgi:hypothetical protein